MPDDGHRYELLDGVLIVSPAPRALHQRVVFRVATALDAAAPPDVDVLPAPLAIRPQRHLPLRRQQTELQPDIVVPAEDAYDLAGLPTAPLLAVEVLSPSARLVDLTLKRAAYERMGSPSYWVVDPEVPDVRAFELDDAGTHRLAAHVAGGDVLDVVRPFPLRLRPADLMGRRR